MEAESSKTQHRYDRLEESIDLFTMVTSMGIQQQLQVQMQLNSHVVEKTVKDQVLLTKQIAETGRVVA